MRISAAVLGCLSLFPVAAVAQAPEAPASEKVTVSPNLEDPCPIPLVLAESAFAITCRSGTTDLLERLRRPDACGVEARRPTNDACAVLIYVIDDYDSARELQLPPTWTVRIGRVSQSEKIEEAAVTLFRANAYEEQLGSERIYELLLPIRLATRIAEFKESGSKKRANESRSFRDKDVHYYPALLVGRGRASEVMTTEDIARHFESRCLFYSITC